MLALVAVVMYLQLRTHVVSPGAIDPMLVIAPATCAIALAALVARLLPLAARAANAGARRARGIALPVAGWHVARGGAAHGTFLVVLAAAVATLGVTFLGTWSTSQSDQADAAVGADLVVSQAGSPGMAGTLAAVTGGTVTPVADRAVVLGTRPDGVMMLALDAGLADKVLRGKLPAQETWSSAMQGLAPEQPGSPVVVEGGTFSVTMTGAPRPVGGSLPDATVMATPTFVLADESGDVAKVVGRDSRRSTMRHTSWSCLVPVSRRSPTERGTSSRSICCCPSRDTTISSAGETRSSPPASASTSRGGAILQRRLGRRHELDVTARCLPAPRALTQGVVKASFSYSVLQLSWQAAHETLLSFPASTEVPVAMSQDLANGLGLAVGDRIAMVWGTTTIEARLVRTVPYVPSHVRQDAVLADLSALHRALLSAGNVDTLTDQWWVSSPTEGAADALRAQHLGPVVTAAETAKAFRDGPVRVSLRVAWAFAIAAAVLLAATGSAAHAAGEALQRAPTVARLRAIGVSRRTALASHLLQHAAVTIAAVLLGAGAGAVLARLIAPLLIVAPGGQRAVPPAVLVWSAAPTALAVAAIAAGGLIAGVPVAVAMVRRSTVSALRAGDAP